LNCADTGQGGSTCFCKIPETKLCAVCDDFGLVSPMGLSNRRSKNYVRVTHNHLKLGKLHDFSSATKVKNVQWQSFARENFRPAPVIGHMGDA
jgi:hypothetical protein